MPIINVLDKQTAELIAAGEVVERPASVVKELVENSIDAGAKNIIVDIERGGIKKILVQDDGTGIDSEYVKTAFIRHATSKISSKEDLDNISSLGFRGEALASIASVSHLSLITKTEIQDFAVEIQLSGGEEVSFEVKPFITGSRFIIRDLFYNTPARMKFLKKDVSEAGYIQDILTNLALSKPEISFVFKKDGKEIFSTIGDGKLKNTIASLFGTELASQLTDVDFSDGKYTLTGFTTMPQFAKQSRNTQYTFINGRFVKNRTIIAAAENAYKGSVMVGKFPGYILNLQMPFDTVDVNVHPAKTEVRFSNDGEIYNIIYRGVKLALSKDLELKQFSFKPQSTFFQDNLDVKQQTITDIKLPINGEIAYSEAKNADYSALSSNNNGKSREYQLHYSADIAETSLEDETLHSGNSISYATKPYQSYHPNIFIPYEDGDKDECNNVTAPANESPSADKINIDEENTGKIYGDEDKQSADEFISSTTDDFSIKVIGEVFATYILCQIGSEMVIIDKHAAHERILYEKFKKHSTCDKQMLLIPATVKLSAQEKSAIFDNLDLLEQIVFEVEDFGLNGVALRAIPMNISSEDPQSLISEIAYNLANGNKSEISAKLDWIFHSVACRSAIKAGDKADINQLTQLVYDIKRDKIPLYCPHGRPVIITITKKELEKQFGR
ncbi:MAG: DNA mismatch repair endonuclease MutL [Oscillospiraceae bacterium]